MLHRLWRWLFAPKVQETASARPAPPAEDALTRLMTRDAMFEHMRATRAAGVRGMAALMDIDHFKQLNATYGLLAGDEVLRSVAERLLQALPEGGWAARMGGNEFWIFLPGMRQPEALAWLEAAQRRLSAPMDLISATVRASFGLAAFTGQSPDTLVSACDVALYAAKARGRNQIVAFDDDTRAAATARRDLAATVIELQQRNRALLDEARTDALTGLRNRRALDETLAAGLGASAVAFLDIDHFGAYNKLHGDSSGDAALRAVAHAVQSAIREEDQAFRKGGEELVVLLAAADPTTVGVAAQRLRQAVQALALPHQGSPTAPVLTVTIGVACAPPGGTLAQALEAASRLAMAGKLAGQRNQVHAAPPAASAVA